MNYNYNEKNLNNYLTKKENIIQEIENIKINYKNNNIENEKNIEKIISLNEELNKIEKLINLCQEIYHIENGYYYLMDIRLE